MPPEAEVPKSTYERELRILAEKTESRRNDLEREAGIEEPEAAAKAAIAEHLRTLAETPTDEAATQTEGTAEPSYLETVSGETAKQVNTLIDRIGEKGLHAAIEEAKHSTAFVLDAFHDTLVDRLYNDLKTKGFL